MTLATLAPAGGLVLVLVGVITLYITMRDRVSGRIEKERVRREKDITDAEQRGRDARNDEMALLRSQRDDARRDRDEARERARDYEKRYNDLLERRRGGDG